MANENKSSHKIDTENDKKDSKTEMRTSDDINMQSGIVDQVNYSHQSNMTLCAYSVITQSFSTVKINISGEMEEESND